VVSCRFVTVVAALGGLLSTPVWAADEQTLARFRREYPESGQRVEFVYSHLRIEMMRHYSTNDEFSHSNRVVFYRDGPRFRFEHERVTPYGAEPAGYVDVDLANDSSWFSASRSSAGAELIGYGYARVADDAFRQSMLMRCFERQLPSLFELYGIGMGGNHSTTIVDLTRTVETAGAQTVFDKIVVTDATTVQEAGRELVRVDWRGPFGTTGATTLSPHDSWIVVAGEWSRETLSWAHRFEFQGSYDGVPLLLGGEQRTRQLRNDTWTEGRWDFEVVSIEPGPIDPAEFDPASVGIQYTQTRQRAPETVRHFPAPPRTQRWYHWILLPLFLAMLYGIRRARRSRTPTS
jgi:hypothetical protein